MRRPAATLEALGRSPLAKVKAGWAHPSCVERIPLIAATTRPAVILAGRPAAQRAADARTGRVKAFLLLEFHNQGRFVVRQGADARLSRLL